MPAPWRSEKPMRFDVAAYGEEACGILARGFCHKLQHFLNLELANPALAQAPGSPEALAAYQEPSEFIKLAERAMGGDKVLRRVAQIRKVLA